MRDEEDPLGLVGTVVEERFQVESIAGKGGFGVVYRATQLRLERAVALKVLIPRADLAESVWSRMAEGFLREAALVAKVQHPNIVQILDHGLVTLTEDREAPWMALEWLEGPTLARELREHEDTQRTPREIIGRVRPLLMALAALHGQGIAHRDVKPSNVMIVRAADGAELLKLLDLGIAKETAVGDLPGSGQTLTQSTTVAFSPRYAAPEQFYGGRTGPWTDVYSAALVVVEMLVGRRARRGESNVDLATAAMDPTGPTPATFGVDAGAWELVLASALSLRPDDRPPNAGALLQVLEASLEIVPAEPPRASAPPLLSKSEPPPPRASRSRRRWVLALVTLGLAALAAGFAFGSRRLGHLESAPVAPLVAPRRVPIEPLVPIAAPSVAVPELPPLPTPADPPDGGSVRGAANLPGSHRHRPSRPAQRTLGFPPP